MNNNYKNKSVCVYDFGTFIELSIRLSKDFGKVYYYSPWQSSFPKSNFMMIGTGLDEIERVNNFFDIIEDVDLFVFPDVTCGDIQVHLEGLGKRVWGSRKGEELELYRDKSKEYLKSLGCDIGPYEVIIGIDNLRKYLKKKDNQWVKLNITRGDMETFHSENYKFVESKLDYLEWNLGAKKQTIKFIVEDAIDNAVESGYDGYCIDGQFPSKGIYGVEIKDRGYIALFQEYKDIPKEITGFNDKISDTLKEYRYKNFISTELRITPEKVSYIIDPCMRAGSPPSEIYMNMYSNLSDIMWNGSEGICIDPIPTAKYGVELMMHSNWAMKNWQSMQFPKELRNNYKFRNLAKIDNEYYVVPQIIERPEVGSVVALGDSLDEAIEKLKEYCEQIQSYDLQTFPDCLDTAKEELEKLGVSL